MDAFNQIAAKMIRKSYWEVFFCLLIIDFIVIFPFCFSINQGNAFGIGLLGLFWLAHLPFFKRLFRAGYVRRVGKYREVLFSNYKEFDNKSIIIEQTRNGKFWTLKHGIFQVNFINSHHGVKWHFLNLVSGEVWKENSTTLEDDVNGINTFLRLRFKMLHVEYCNK